MSNTPFQRVTLIGAGNVAWHLALALKKKGVRMVEVYSRNITHAQNLAEKVGAMPVDNLERISLQTDLILVAVKDNALTDIASALPTSIPVAHTSGSVGIEVFPHPQRGVFYPLQTFTKGNEVEWKHIPICIEASNKALEDRLIALAQKMSNNVHQLDSTKRGKLHLAAVFACNFTNHLIGLSSDLLREEGLDLHLLDALVSETVRKALKDGAHAVQTGPAYREDTAVIDQHLKLLKAHPRLHDLYNALSNSIIATKYGKEL